VPWEIHRIPNAEESTGILLQRRKLREHIDHRWHQHSVRDAFALDRLAEALRIELWYRNWQAPKAGAANMNGKSAM